MSGLAALAAMWTVMMAAMMLPAATPMIRVCAGAALRRNGRLGGLGWIAAFALGYLAVWSAYGVAAALLQWLVQAERFPREASGALLVAAGLYQWAPFKHFCLERCRSPLSFILLHWRASAAGAFLLGVRHGGYCVGCCWALMLLLFVGGVMNLAWIVLLALLVLAERTFPGGPAIARAVGVLAAVAGSYFLFGG